MTDRRTLVLNSDFSPISIFPLSHISAQDAVVRVMNGTCIVVDEYDDYIKTPNFEMKWPSVIARKEYLNRERVAVLNKTTLMYRDGKKCAFCLKPLSNSEATIDHVTPKHKGGQHRWENVVCSCGPCNHAKSNSPPVGVWKPKITPYRPTYRKLMSLRRLYSIKIFHKSWEFFLGDWKGEVVIQK